MCNNLILPLGQKLNVRSGTGIALESPLFFDTDRKHSHHRFHSLRDWPCVLFRYNSKIVSRKS